MIFPFEISLPFTDPVLVFSLVLFIILFAPLLLKKFRIPGIVGLILAGVAVGPKGFHLLEKSDAVNLFGTIGLLYIMFLAGLEMDMAEFRKNRRRSFVFGLLTFAIPLAIGIPVCHFVLGMDWVGSVLLGSMFSTQTLVSYPIASRLGITRTEPVIISVGGTIITDLLVLIILAVIESYKEGHFGQSYWISMGFSLLLLIFTVTALIPWITRWFFRNLSSEGGSLYIYVLAVVFISAFIAKMAGVDIIIGAFLAGLALNPLIPHTSTLMNRISFVGNTIFIPFFLISVGMIIDLRVFGHGTEALFIAGVLVLTAILTKWLAAYTSGRLFRFSKEETGLLFGLSTSHAAATLAIILVGFRTGIINENGLNGTILVILVSCLVSSFVTENTGRKVAVRAREADVQENPEIPQRILVPISHPSSLEWLFDFSRLIREPGSPEPVYPLSVVNDDGDAREKVFVNQRILENILKPREQEIPYQVVTRVDINPAWGILRAMKEKAITDLVIGFSGKGTAREVIFGTIRDAMLEGTDQTIWVVKMRHNLNSTQKIHVQVPPNAWLELGFRHWIDCLKRFSLASGGKLCFYGDRENLERISFRVSRTEPEVSAEFEIAAQFEHEKLRIHQMKNNDLFVLVHCRQGRISWDQNHETLLKELERENETFSTVVIYPEQPGAFEAETLKSLAAGMETSPIRENIERFNRLKSFFSGRK